MLQKNSQLCEQGAAVWVSSGCVAESEESVVNERQQQAPLATEKHENSGWHQKDLITSDELKDVLLIGCKFVQEVSDEHQAAGAHRIKDFLCVGSCMKQGEEEDREDAHCDGVGVDQDERVQQIMAAILLKSLRQESSAQLKAWKPLMQAKGTGEGVR